MDFKLIMVFVDHNRTEAVLDAAREAGATGATIINNAQGSGLKPQLTFFGLEFMASRSVILTGRGAPLFRDSRSSLERARTG